MSERPTYDFDILREAAEVVLANKPASPVGVLADGSTPVTAFIPNDRAFQVLEYSLTRTWERSEQATPRAAVRRAEGPGPGRLEPHPREVQGRHPGR